MLTVLSILFYKCIQLEITLWHQFLNDRHRVAAIFNIYRKNWWSNLDITIGSSPRCGNSCTCTCTPHEVYLF